MRECEVMKFWKVLECLALGSRMLMLKPPQAIMYFLLSIIVSMLSQTSLMDCDGALGGR